MKPVCQECEDGVAEFRDPRHPPLDTGDQVLCDPCFQAAVEQRIEELQDEIDLLQEEVVRLT